MTLGANGLPSPSTAWKEIPLPGEAALFKDFAGDIVAYQKKDADKDGRPLRGFHAKIHAGLIAEFQVLADLPEHARYGVFAEPRTFPALVRFSNGESRIYADTNHEPRGIAIKLIGVPGRKLLPGREGDVTQDFLGTSHSVTSAVHDVTQFIAFVRAARIRKGLFGKLRRSIGLWQALRIMTTLLWTVRLSRVRSMATEYYSSTAPIKFGPYAVKFTVQPEKKTAAPAHRPLTADFLRDELADRLRENYLAFDFMVQFYVNDTHTPIEKTSVRWKEKHAPKLKVAQLRIPRCDLDDPESCKLSKTIDRLSFSPWHATEDHRPLGNVMRARRVAYEASAALRDHSPEPTSIPL
jgi:hypothetical protein